MSKNLGYDDQWLELAGLMPPLPLEKSAKLISGQHTYLPFLVTRDQYYKKILPELQKNNPAELVEFISTRVHKTFEIRDKLKRLKNKIETIVGAGNFSALWLDREAFSADSMEHRALVTEAVVRVYSAHALQKIVKLFYTHKIPMIPYGEGGGYNMGVTPMAPSVTISLRGIDHISEIKPSRWNSEKFEITVGAGVPFKDLVSYLNKRNFVLRCDPNTPRAATGGIAATGSNGGRKAFEVITQGRAITACGTAVKFGLSPHEQLCIQQEPFLLAQKFFSIDNIDEFETKLKKSVRENVTACITPSAQKLSIPLRGFKSSYAHLHQKYFADDNVVDTMENLEPLPVCAFVGAEGTTGFIYEVTFEIEKPNPWLMGSRWHFSSVDAAISATKAVKALNKSIDPQFFEIISGASIQRYLIHDFPTTFSTEDAAVIIIGIEGKTKEDAYENHKKIESAIKGALEHNPEAIIKTHFTQCMNQFENNHEFEILKKPREELPKKLRTKCKTDMEIRTEYLGHVFDVISKTKLKNKNIHKQDVLFGHLTPLHTAIIHWNIGGFDLYNEDQADIAWEYLEDIISKAQSFAPAHEKYASARFTGEHGLAGKAPFLWLNHIDKNDFERMCRIKDLLDPDDLYNPETIFLRTQIARSLRARLLNTSSKLIQNNLSEVEKFVVDEALKCTRCNSCKICPVIDAQHEIEREGKQNSKPNILPSKRDIIMFLEKIVHLRKSATETNDRNYINAVFKKTNSMLSESKKLLKNCFFCRRCDKACPVNIDLHPMVQAYTKLGKIPTLGSKFWGFLYDRLMGFDFFKAYTIRLLALVLILSRPLFKFLRKIKLIPVWLKTYFAPPEFALIHYEPLKNGIKLKSADNFVYISKEKNKNVIQNDFLKVNEVYIRYRGCMDTFARPEATRSVDEYFNAQLGVSIVDLEKKLCCGFPYEAEGLVEKAKEFQIRSLVEIVKCIVSVRDQQKLSSTVKFFVFSNCPTCTESIMHMRELLNDELVKKRIIKDLKLPAAFNFSYIDFKPKDTVEIAVNLIGTLEKNGLFDASNIVKKQTNVGLKIPCHNSSLATKAQMALLNMYYTGVSGYDRCCGLSGTGRIKHPKIGTKISEKLFEQIEEHRPNVIVSGCPSCRDGVKMQRDILHDTKSGYSDFSINGIFEQINRDFLK